MLAARMIYLLQSHPVFAKQRHTLSVSTWLRRMGPFRPGHSLPSPSLLPGESHWGGSAPMLIPAGLEISSDTLIKKPRFSWCKAKRLSREWCQPTLSVHGPYLSEEKILHSPHPACDMRLDKICLGGMTWPAAQLSDHSNRTLSL